MAPDETSHNIGATEYVNQLGRAYILKHNYMATVL
jgi:hypothetical protein